MAYLGVISLQSNTKKDVFFKGFVQSDDSLDVDEGIERADRASFETDFPWISGKKPQPVEVNVEGDTCVIYGWFRGNDFPGFFTITVYIEYEESEEIIEEENTHDRDIHSGIHSKEDKRTWI